MCNTISISPGIRLAGLAALIFAMPISSSAETPLIIAHRGASGYLPEHTLAAKALAFGMHADYIEQDVVLTKDDRAVVLHDIHLDTVTNVSEAFPDRARADGRFYAIDFTLDELRELTVSERFHHETGKPVYPNRFPPRKSRFRIHTLADEIELIQGLNASASRTVGIYTEIKQPSWHRRAGKDISKIVLSVLRQYGYQDRRDKVYLQCFDPIELKRIRNDLDCKLKLVQLVGDNSWAKGDIDYDAMRVAKGLKMVAEYADGIGPWLPHIVRDDSRPGNIRVTPLVADAHRIGLEVHPYTLRADDLPSYANDFGDLVRIFAKDAGVDGFFTDFPDQAAAALR